MLIPAGGVTVNDIITGQTDLSVVGRSPWQLRRAGCGDRRRHDYRMVHRHRSQAGRTDRRSFPNRSSHHDHPGARGGHELHDVPDSRDQCSDHHRLPFCRAIWHCHGRLGHAFDHRHPAGHRRLRPDCRQRRRRRRDGAAGPRHSRPYRQARCRGQHHRRRSARALPSARRR